VGKIGAGFSSTRWQAPLAKRLLARPLARRHERGHARRGCPQARLRQPLRVPWAA
jgi:hypothetical protein